MGSIFRLALIAAVLSVAACGGNDKKPVAPAPEPAPQAQPAPEPEPEPEPAPEPEALASLGEVIYFEFDSSELSEESRQILEQNAEWLRESADRTLMIEGHTDEVGTPAYNLALGERRAGAARDYLLRLGIEDKRISIITYGEEKPASAEDSKNRRSVFVSTK